MKSIKFICAIILVRMKLVFLATVTTKYEMDEAYDKNIRPSELTEVSISLYINRISAVDENKEEISFDVFLQDVWTDHRIKPKELGPKHYIELTMEQRVDFWVPDLYIRQLREIKISKVFEEISSLRIYENSTISRSIGATIIIKCDMDFVLYPLDVQFCPVDFSSYKYTVNEMAFRWRKDHPLTFPNDFGENGFRLPKYVVSFETHEKPHKINFDGDADRISARLDITLSREVKSYLLENYLPSTLFTVISWGSFLIIPTIVPGRMVLLVTTLLSLVTMFDTVRNNSPDALELKSIEVWLLCCTFFVFLALMEYFVVLFGIRYDSHWRRSQLFAAAAHVQSQHHQQQNPQPSPSRIQITNQTLAIPTTISSLPNVETPMTSLQPNRKNGLENATRMFQANKVNPEGSRSIRDLASSTAESLNNAEKVSSIMGRKRFRNVADVALLYAGSTRGKLDQISLILFPVSFLLFTIIYWVLYLNESRKNAL